MLLLQQSQQQPQPIFLQPHPQNPIAPAAQAPRRQRRRGLPSILRSLARASPALSPLRLPAAPRAARNSGGSLSETRGCHDPGAPIRRFLAAASRAARGSEAAGLRQSSDPIIREGKRSVSRELVRISEFVDKVLIKESNDSQSQLEELERRRDRGRRRVSFAECNGREDNLFDDFPERIADIEEEALRGFYDRSSENEESPKAMRHERANGFSQRMAPPLPVRMEPMRNGSVKKMVADEED
ncbi:uncharacterized protein A4U43_UnF370 [Asparagus officinalis]|uniref:Uncharacterized protein n=1 Tax=Asparagus officinalis TaxID=4686 RepID=A0A1R3L7T0_ASPOF|nr:uncharacterized protein A4U43_UnF370 [Asparagus officinalis]